MSGEAGVGLLFGCMGQFIFIVGPCVYGEGLSCGEGDAAAATAGEDHGRPVVADGLEYVAHPE